jgi:hypothetical protein
MLKKLGTLGIAGVLLTLGGLALITVIKPLIGAGLALVLAGLGLVVKGLVDGLMSQFGFA